MKVRWLTTALRNLEREAESIAEVDPAASRRIVARIFESVDQLAEFPHLGRPGRISDTRELVVSGTPYIVPYRVRQEYVEILRVFHGSRKWLDNI